MQRQQILKLTLGLQVPIMGVYIWERNWPTAMVSVVGLFVTSLALEFLRREDVEQVKIKSDLDALKTKVDGLTAMLSMRTIA